MFGILIIIIGVFVVVVIVVIVMFGMCIGCDFYVIGFDLDVVCVFGIFVD